MKLRGTSPHELTGLYALDALTGADQDNFERHLGTCPPCIQEVRGLHELTSELALAAAAPPPPQLRDRVLTALPSVVQVRAGTDRPAQQAAAPDRSRRSARSHPAHKRPRAHRRGAMLPGLAYGFAAVATAIAVVLGIRLSSVQSQLGVSQAEQHAEQQALTQMLHTPGVRVLATAARGGLATAVIVPGQQKAVLLTMNLPVLPASKVYQVWLIGKKIRSAGLLEHVPAGGTALLVASGVLKNDVLGITVEPAGGTAQPTMNPFVAIHLGH
jgi:anti-sigma-K factor RskA/putative zinc finger protein